MVARNFCTITRWRCVLRVCYPHVILIATQSLLDDVREQRIPSDFLELFDAAKLPFYDGDYRSFTTPLQKSDLFPKEI